MHSRVGFDPVHKFEFQLSFQLLDWPVGSDSLNYDISPRARWVVSDNPGGFA